MTTLPITTVTQSTGHAEARVIDCPHLYARYAEGRAQDANGRWHELREEIPLAYAEALYKVVAAQRPSTALEVGHATGTSALAMGAALASRRAENARLISIDPGQADGWQDIGRTAMRTAGLDDLHELVEEFDYLALPRLLADGVRLQFAYIDGWHTFDYVLLDFFYIDKMLDEGGVIGFNDCGWPATHKVLRFLCGHRRYSEIDAGLPRTYRGRVPLAGTVAKRLSGRSDPDRYFRKLADWEPDDTKFYARF